MEYTVVCVAISQTPWLIAKLRGLQGAAKDAVLLPVHRYSSIRCPLSCPEAVVVKRGGKLPRGKVGKLRSAIVSETFLMLLCAKTCLPLLYNYTLINKATSAESDP